MTDHSNTTWKHMPRRERATFNEKCAILLQRVVGGATIALIFLFAASLVARLLGAM